MKKLYLVYGAVVVGLTIAGAVWVLLAMHDSSVPALRMLGRGERAFHEARNELIMNTTNPAPLLVAFALQKRNSVRARQQALEILRELAVNQPLATFGRPLAPLLREDSRSLVIATLAALAAFETAEPADSARRLLMDPDTATAAAAHRFMLGAAKGLERRIAAAVTERNRPAVDSCLALARGLPLPKDGIYQTAADYFGGAGDTARAAAYTRAMGGITSWLICGQFDNTNWQGIGKAFGPETQPMSRTSTYQGANGKPIAWRPVAAEPNGQMDVWHLVDQHGPATVYLTATARAPSERTAFVYTSTVDAIKLWVNDSAALCIPTPGNHRGSEGWARVRLHKGDNRILAKLCRQEEGGWDAAVRLTDTNGEAMGDVTVAAE
jgi:hypothetical protein